MGVRDLDTVNVPVQVRAMVSTFLREVDIAAPGLIEMLYLTGSVALDDYRPGVSDIDFLAITSRTLGDGDLGVIADIHRDMPNAPHVDGLYLDSAALTARPDDEGVVPHAVDGVFVADKRCGELNPVLWLMLGQCGIAVRGPSARELDIQVDPDRVRTWNLANLSSYWKPLAGRIRQAMARRDAAKPVYNDGVMWTVLGPARLHYTLATGAVTSKTGAGQYVADHFPQWSSLAQLAVTCRDGEPIEFVTADALAAADLIDAVVGDAWVRWG
jgi:hypothetical protein